MVIGRQEYQAFLQKGHAYLGKEKKILYKDLNIYIYIKELKYTNILIIEYY